jgi:hypothetical protein
MKYAVEMGLEAMMYEYVPSFMKIGSRHSKKLIGGIRRQTDTQTAR